MGTIITAVVFFFLGKYWEKITDWWNASQGNGLGDS